MTRRTSPASTTQHAKPLSRREMMAMSTAFGSAFLAKQGLLHADVNAGTTPIAAEDAQAPKTYDMKKSINLWALPYPERMTLRQCLELCKEAGFEGVELNYALDGDLSPQASEDDIQAIGRMAADIGIEIAGLCSFLFWPYPFTAEDPQRREQGIAFAEQMIRAAALVGTEDVLIVPGAAYVWWMPEQPPVPHDVCEARAVEAMQRLIPQAEAAGVHLNVENIFVNGFLHSPQEINAFVDQFDSEHVHVHFDTGNIMQYHFPEHWIPMLGQRTKHVHLKEHSRNVHEFSIHTFRPLLDGSTNWPAVLEALDAVGYRGYLTFEYFNPYPYHPDMLVRQTSQVLDRLLGRNV